jgi:hypothetical protein
MQTCHDHFCLHVSKLLDFHSSCCAGMTSIVFFSKQSNMRSRRLAKFADSAGGTWDFFLNVLTSIREGTGGVH